MSEALINDEISHEDLKENIRMMKSQRSDTQKINSIVEGKK